MGHLIEAEAPGLGNTPEIPTNTALTAHSPAGVMLAALQQGATLEHVEKMTDLRERREKKNEAKKAYDPAFAAFKAESVTITKGRTRAEVPLKEKVWSSTPTKKAAPRGWKRAAASSRAASSEIASTV